MKNEQTTEHPEENSKENKKQSPETDKANRRRRTPSENQDKDYNPEEDSQTVPAADEDRDKPST